MRLLNGFDIAEEKKKCIKEKLSTLNKKPSLHVVLVGENPASVIYVGKKEQACAFVGIKSTVHKLKDYISTQELVEFITSLNNDKDVDAILLQLPLPQHINQKNVIESIHPGKDADGLTSINLGKLFQGSPHIVPCTPQGCLQLIQSAEPNIAGKNVVILGRSVLVGKPLASLLLGYDATVMHCHSKTKNVQALTKQADILISAIGKPLYINDSFVKDSAIVIDVGISRLPNNSIVGDVDFETVKHKVKAISPVPKGVGPMTVLNLLMNTLKCADVPIDDIFENI